MIHLEFTAHIDTSPPIETFLCTNPNQTTSAHCIIFIMYPLRKTHLKFIIPHGCIIKRKIFFGHCLFRHGTNPYILFAVFPRTPKRLIHRGAGSHTERDAYPVYIQNIPYWPPASGLHSQCHFILDLIIHVKKLPNVPSGYSSGYNRYTYSAVPRCLYLRRMTHIYYQFIKYKLQSFLC